MRCLNNVHKIVQVDTKMNKEFQDENNRKTTIKCSSEQELDETEEIESNNSDSGEDSSDEANVVDHMYHSSDTNIIIDVETLSESHILKHQDLTSSPVTSGDCQTLESEVKFIKEWLILHTDLIQQQNDDILDKDREIYLLRKENEMLRERILCIEKGIVTPFEIPLVPCGTSSSSDSVSLLNHNQSNHHSSECDQHLNSSEQQQKPVDNQHHLQLDVTSGALGVPTDMTQGPCRPCNNNIANCTKQNTNISVAQEGACIVEEKESVPLGSCDELVNRGVESRTEAEVTVGDYHQRSGLLAVGSEENVTGRGQVVEEEEEEDDEFVEKSGSFGAEAEAATEAALLREQAATDPSLQLEALSAASPSDIADITATPLPTTHVTYSVTIGGGRSTGGDTVAAATTAYLGQEPAGTGGHRSQRGARRSSRGLTMSIRRKRASSGSADNHRQGAATTTPTTTPVTADPSQNTLDIARSTKEVQMLETTEPYITQAHEVNFGIALPDPDISDSPSTLEGTENLDDEVFNKRHLRLENDERRRKRWDVQRIREQRVIEKLKQRQERASFGYCGGGDNATGAGTGGGVGGCHLDHEHKHQLHSLWPSLDDVRFLEVCERLPVAAFGHAMPRMQPSEFSLPWLTNPSYLQRRPTSQQMARRSQIRRRSAKR
nr:unnamed protein product [Callosobruchus chinensis]